MTADFAALVRAHQGAVCATAYAVLRDRARSEEVAQDAFLIAWRKLPQVSPAPALPAWICGIARNLARNVARKRTEVAMDAAHDPTTSATPLDDTLTREEHEVASRALAMLSDGDREIVVMYYRGDESFRSVALALGITEATARQRVHRGRERLRAAVTAVEATLRASRPGAAFTAGCVAALAAGAAPAHVEAAPFVASTRTLPIALGVASIAALGAGVLVATISRGPDPHETAQTTGGASGATGDVPTASPAPRDPRARPSLLARISAADRAAHLARAREALARVSATAPAAEDKVYDFAGSRLDEIEIPTQVPAGPLSKTTIRYAIKLVQPLLLECLTDPEAHGTLKVRLHLIGEPETATLVETVDIAGDPPLSTEAPFVECVTRTLETIELPPMAAPERWRVDYPFVL